MDTDANTDIKHYLAFLQHTHGHTLRAHILRNSNRDEKADIM